MMDIVSTEGRITAMTTDDIAKVKAAESIIAAAPQLDLETWHTIHAGIYSRTIMLPAGYVLTGALLKVDTTVTVNGNCLMYMGSDFVHINGHQVFAASAGRKQLFVANTDTWITMSLHTDLDNISDIERHMTDEYESLASNRRTSKNHLVVTGGSI